MKESNTQLGAPARRMTQAERRDRSERELIAAAIPPPRNPGGGSAAIVPAAETLAKHFR